MAKKGGSKQKKMDTRVNFTPMVDMMMLLITFFMLCTTLSKPQAMQLTMPSNDENMTKEDKSVTKASYTITLYLGGEDKIYYVEGLPDYENAECVKETTWGKDGVRKLLIEHITEDGFSPVARVLQEKQKLDKKRAELGDKIPKEEYEKYINRKEMICGDSVAAFIRSIVGVDRQLAKEKFSQFLNNSPLNALQDEYINQIIGYVCENGDITPETLFYNEDFANLDWRGVFGTNLPNVGRYVNELHSLIG